MLQALSNLSSAADLTFESERALEVALQLYREDSAEFADCLHLALASEAGEQPLWTFDQAAAKVIGAQLLRTGSLTGSRRRKVFRSRDSIGERYRVVVEMPLATGGSWPRVPVRQVVHIAAFGTRPRFPDDRILASCRKNAIAIGRQCLDLQDNDRRCVRRLTA